MFDALSAVLPANSIAPVSFKERYGNFIGGKFVPPGARPLLSKRHPDHRQGRSR